MAKKHEIRVEILGPGLYRLWVGAGLLGTMQTNGKAGWRAFPLQVGKAPSRKFWPSASSAAGSMWGKAVQHAVIDAEAEARRKQEGA